MKGPYPVRDWLFWAVVHLALIVTLPATLALNWRFRPRRRLVVVSLAAYLVGIAVTVAYFGPELLAFADSASSTVERTEWFARGQLWQRLSWMRGGLMYLGFVPLLLTLTKPESATAPHRP